jgi:hypothetical protein
MGVLHPTDKIAYPDLKRGIPSLLLCIEMAFFALMHLFAFPWQPYGKGSRSSKYPLPSSGMDELEPKQGGFLGMKAFVDAMNPWDLVKAFARGMRWLFVGVKHRENDASYKPGSFDMNDNEATPDPYKRNVNLPIANEFRRSKFGMPTEGRSEGEEGAGLIAHAQPNPLNPSSGYVPARQRYDMNGQDISQGGARYENMYPEDNEPDRLTGHHPTPESMRQENMPAQAIGVALTSDPQPYHSHVVQQPYATPQSQSQAYLEQKRHQQGHRPKPSEQWANSSTPVNETRPEVHNALWGPGPVAGTRHDNQF